jgi:DNA-binding beta-propeller fold protein YncE
MRTCYRLGVILAACVAACTILLTSHADEAATPAAPPAGIDLDVTYINRAPLYQAYCVQYPWDVPNQPGIPFLCPGTEHDRRWPEPGENVTFTAHVINKGTVASPAFGYTWAIDGVGVGGGVLPALAPGAEATAALQWPWPHDLSPDGQRALGEHSIRFTVDPANAIAESYETNNSLEDRTDAMSFSIYLRPDMYAAYNVPVDARWPWSAEDWLQKQIAAMNANFAAAVYPVTPQGAGLRVRINHIGVTPANPGPDGQHDGGWWIQDEVRCEGCGYYDIETDIDWGLIHELSHQVALIDLYAIGVYASNVFALDQEGLPANVGFGWDNGGLMGGGDISPYTDHRRYSSHSAGGANTFAGYRNGYYGAYLFDIPLNNKLHVLDNQGNPAPGVTVAIYQRTGPWDWTGQMGVDDRPEMSGVTDANGDFALPNRSANGGTVTANGHVLHDNPFGVVDIIGNQGLLLVRLTKAGHEEFHWLDITQFNLAYWAGNVANYTITLATHTPPPDAPAAPTGLTARIEGGHARLAWQPSPSANVAGYRVYRAAAPQYRYTAASSLLTTTTFEEEAGGWGDGEHRLYAVAAVGDQGRESGFSARVYAPYLEAPTAVTLAPDGSRTALNRGNLYPLLRQEGNGRFTHRLVNVHYDLSNAAALTYDAEGRLWISGFGESPNGRFAVRGYDTELQPLMAFGEAGAQPGQFSAPTGIAAWGEPCTVAGPYEVDEQTLLLLHLDNSYTGAQGQMGTANGTEFVDGRYAQGVLIDEADTLTYATAGNLNRTQGAIEFWLKPNWPGNDMENYVFFEVGDEWFNRLRITKDGANNLRFMMWDSATEYGVAYNVGHWQAGEWHHVAVTWQDTTIALYADGILVGREENAHPPDFLSSLMYIGSTAEEGQQANAVIDELRISNTPRLGNSDVCGRILVADSGNHRVQAFNSLGNFLTAFGQYGSGEEQFSNPQGMVVDGDGRVIVVDQGNNRLVRLAFDGEAFSYLDSITAGFNAPTGIAGDARGYLAVADTGNNRIVVLDPQGNFRGEFSAPNDGYTGSFSAPRGVAIAANGDLVVADTGNRRVVTVRGALPPPGQIWLPLVMRR